MNKHNLNYSPINRGNSILLFNYFKIFISIWKKYFINSLIDKEQKEGGKAEISYAGVGNRHQNR